MEEITKALKKGGMDSLVPYIEKPITNLNTLNSLQKRANLFEYDGHALPCTIIPEFTFDMGSQKLNKQLFMSVVDLNKNDKFLEFISKKLKYKATPINTGACLIVERNFESSISKKVKKPVLIYEESIVLIRLHEDGNVTPYIMTPVKLQPVFVRKKEYARDEAKNAKIFNKLVLPYSSLISDLNDTVIVWNGNQWGIADYIHQNNFDIKGRCNDKIKEQLSTVSLGAFRPMAAVQKSLHIGIIYPVVNYEDTQTKLVIPGLSPSCNRLGFGNHIIKMNELHTTVGSDSTGGGAGSGSRVDTGVSYSGDFGCSEGHNDIENCYSCCNTKAGLIAAAGGTVGVGIGTAVALGATGTTSAGAAVGALITAAAAGPAGWLLAGGVILVFAVAIGGALVLSAAAAEYCKHQCSYSGAFPTSGAVRDSNGDYIT